MRRDTMSTSPSPRDHSLRIHLPRPSVLFMRGDASLRGIITMPPRRRHMNVKKIFGFVAIAGLLFVAAPAERAQALSLSGPGIAASVQGNVGDSATTQVQYRHGYRPHRGYGRPHYGYRRHDGWRRPHFAPRHHGYGRRHYRY
jgi:hypothetical protein